METDLIKTKRLTLRAPDIGDADAVTASLQNWEIISRLSSPPFPFKRQDAVNWLTGLGVARQDGSIIGFAICLEGQHIGVVDVGLKSGTYELGYWLAQDHWGKGYMNEAIAALLELVFRTRDIALVASRYFNENPKSGRVLEKAGFVVDGQINIWSNANNKDMPSKTVKLTRERWMELNR